MVPSTRSVRTSAPPTEATLPASSRAASGVSGSVPGRSLPSGRIVIGRPVSPETMSGSATAAKDSVASLSCTRIASCSVTGAPTPSPTAYSTWTTPASTGAVKRTRPAAVVRASAPDLSPAHGGGRHEGQRVAVARVAPVGQHRDVEGPARGHHPLARAVARPQGRLAVDRQLARADRHRRLVGDPLAAVVDDVVERRGADRVGRELDLHGLPVGTDRERHRARRPRRASGSPGSDPRVRCRCRGGAGP